MNRRAAYTAFLFGVTMLGNGIATKTHTTAPPSNNTAWWSRQRFPVRLNAFKQPTRLLSVHQLLKVLDLCCSHRHQVRIANFGAGEYRPTENNLTYTLDPVNEILMHAKLGHALLVDPDPDRLQRVVHQLPNKRVFARAEFATPETVSRQLRKAQLNKNLTVLKIDIDCFDCSLLSAVLDIKELHPAVIVMEANVKYPPPLRFNVGFVSGMTLGSRLGKPWGCSLAYQAAFLGERNYSLLHLDTLDAVFVRDDLWPFPWRPLHARETFEAHFLNFKGVSNFRPPMWGRAHTLLADAKGSSARLLRLARTEPASQDEKIRTKGEKPAPWNLTL